MNRASLYNEFASQFVCNEIERKKERNVSIFETYWKEVCVHKENDWSTIVVYGMQRNKLEFGIILSS